MVRPGYDFERQRVEDPRLSFAFPTPDNPDATALL